MREQQKRVSAPTQAGSGRRNNGWRFRGSCANDSGARQSTFRRPSQTIIAAAGSPIRHADDARHPSVDGVNHADRDLAFDVWWTTEDMLLGEPLVVLPKKRIHIAARAVCILSGMRVGGH
jgi:hypothetical protein